jgi:type I restriction enzyme M protein
VGRFCFTLEENPLKRNDLDEFVACYFGQSGSGVPPLKSGGERRDASSTLSRHIRMESERFKCFTYDELLKRDKVNLDIYWLKDESLEESTNLPAPEIIAQETSDDLEAALEQFATIAEDLKS